MENRRGKGGSSDRFPLLGLYTHCRWWLQAWNQKTISSWQESCDKPRQCVANPRQYSADKGLYSQGYGLPSGHVCESWTVKKAEHWRIDAFKLWCWRRLLKVPWTARRSNQSILREINPEYSLEGLTLKLNLQYFGHMRWRVDSLEKSLMLGKIEGRRRRGCQRMRWLMASPMQWTWTWANFGRWWGTGGHDVLQSMGSKRVGHNWTTKQQQYNNVYILIPSP